MIIILWSKVEMQKNQTKKTITGWALQVTWSDGREEILTDIDDQTAGEVDHYLNLLELERDVKNKNK